MEHHRAGEVGDVALDRIDVAKAEREERFLDPTGFRNQLLPRDRATAHRRIVAKAMPQAKEPPLQREGLATESFRRRGLSQFLRTQQIAREVRPAELSLSRRVRRRGRQAVAAEHATERGTEQPPQDV